MKCDFKCKHLKYRGKYITRGNELGYAFQSFSALPVLSGSFSLASRREKEVKQG